jgi:hypothetical protein
VCPKTLEDIPISGALDESELIRRSLPVHNAVRLINRSGQNRLPKEKIQMKNAIIGMTITMALAGVSLFAQTSPAPATSKMANASATKGTTKKAGVKHHAKSTSAKSASKTATATTK